MTSRDEPVAVGGKRVWTSRYEPVAVGGMTFDAVVDATVRAHGDRVAIVDGASGEALTYAALAGRLMPNVELRVVDSQTGKDRSASEDGELLLRGPQTMAGYLNAPEATAEILDADGWLHTCDFGHIDAAGNLFIVDRLKELIKVDALQVAPAELEALLATHPAVADCAVVPQPDERHGEVPVAVVVARAPADADELIAFVADRVAPHKRIRAVRFADAIPGTPAGKILRRRLRDQPSYV
jgi:acyl-CoA synthetase (AMP-forming)/AMP-acid ligase II